MSLDEIVDEIEIGSFVQLRNWLFQHHLPPQQRVHFRQVLLLQVIKFASFAKIELILDKHGVNIDGNFVLLKGVAIGLGDKEEEGPAEVGVRGLPPLVGSGFFYTLHILISNEVISFSNCCIPGHDSWVTYSGFALARLYHLQAVLAVFVLAYLDLVFEAWLVAHRKFLHFQGA